MYSGGDDIGAVVADVGTCTTKVGFAGEDAPRGCFATAVGMMANDESSHAMKADTPVAEGDDSQRQPPSSQYYFEDFPPLANLELKRPMEDGLVTDWDLLERLWEYSASAKLQADLSQRPVLLAEKSFNPSEARRKCVEVMFEKFRTPAVFMSKDAVLSCFACGRTTGTVADIGGATTVVTPVCDGWVEAKGMSCSLLGTEVMQRYQLGLLQDKGIKVPPRPRRKAGSSVAGPAALMENGAASPPLHPTLAAHLQREVARDMLETAARVSDTVVDDSLPQFSNVPGVPYNLPDGTEIALHADRFKVPELLFDPSPVMNPAETMGQPPPWLLELAESLQKGPRWSSDPLQNLIVGSVVRCEKEQQAQLMASVVLAGGGSCFENLPERLKTQIETLIEPKWKLRFLTPSFSERKVCAWLGGSILGSLGTFHEMWMSRAEYEEHGAHLIDRKCP